MIDKMIRCPVLEQAIDKAFCFECAMAVEGWGASRILMVMEEATPDFKTLCLNCERHPKPDPLATHRR
jgi:hypothetical protein